MLANVVSGMWSGGQFEHVVVEMIGGGECGMRIRKRGIRVCSLGMTRGRPSPAAVLRFTRLLRELRPSIVQSWLYHADLLALLAIPVVGAQVVWNIRSAWHLGIGGVVPRLCAWLSKLPSAVIVNSEAGQRVHAARGYRPRRWCLIGNGFDPSVFKPDQSARTGLRAELGLIADAPLIGLVGRWDPHKDHAMFLVAAAQLSVQRSDVHFALVGEGLTSGNAALCELIDDLNLGKRIHLLGRRTDIPRITAALDVAACTSIAEAFPNVVGEAMCTGVPCVATDVGDCATVLGDSSTIVPARDHAALAAAWSRLLSMDQASRCAKGLEGRARIVKYYSLETVVEQYESLYRELLATNSQRAERNH